MSQSDKGESPLQYVVDKLMARVNADVVTTTQMKDILIMAAEMRDGLLEPGGLPENDWWANQAILDFTEIIIRANYRAQRIINPQIDIGSLDDQIREGLDEMRPHLK